jgi:predicted ArsR family transcriptional regulator
MPSTMPASVRPAILEALKLEGSLTVAQLAERLGVTESAIRQQLTLLESEGLLEYQDLKGRRGRPLRQYRLSASGDERFTRTYASLAESLLESLRDRLGPQAVETAFEGRREQMEAELRPMVRSATLRERVGQFAEAMATRGYMPTVAEDEQGISFSWHNCPVARVARQFAQPCAQEIRLIESLLGEPVSRETCIAKGDTACRYRIVSRPAEEKQQ